MSRTFQPDDRIAHYRVVGPLGSGGMGEVYIAQDEKLERSVALKVLPPELVRNEEKVRRFVSEARSASSLSHPNIVTIHEIGQGQPLSGADAEPAGEPIHYITMELVHGETLDQKIHAERTDLRTLVGYAAQAAEGVAKAHAAGIVHRDLKPGNIMVSKDGFAKVLDFGLAKLAERETTADDLTATPTATRPGTVMGTVGYMSPEQVQAKPADHRSDIFSMGVILYEAATRRRPFVADTDVEVMHQILKGTPLPVEELNPEVPTALRRLIRRCMAKSPDQRVQSMKGLAIELRELVDEWDSLNVTSSSSRTLSSGAREAPPARRGLSLGLILAASAIGLAGLAFGLYGLLGQGRTSAGDASAGRGVQMSSLMSRSDLSEAVLSADGRYLAYVTSSGRLSNLLVRQVRTGSDVTIVGDSEVPIRGISFSPDGDYLFFLNRDPDLPNYSALFQVASLGGTPRKVLFDVDGAATFSPDGKQLCFHRGLITENADSLVVARLESGEERELVRVEGSVRFRGQPAWSPDGRTIAAGLQSVSGGVRAWVEAIDVETGEHEPLVDTSWLDLDSLGWLPGGGGLVVAAFDPGAGTAPQLYRLSYPGGRVVRITSDLDGYGNVSVSSTGDAFAAVRRSTVSNMWVARADRDDDLTALTFASGSAASMGQIAPLPGDATAFTAPRDNHFYVWRTRADGSDRRQLTTQGVWVIDIAWSERIGIVFTQVDRQPEVLPHVWRVSPDGSGVEQLTRGGGEQLASLSPSGNALLFRKWQEPGEIWVLKLDGSEPYLLAERTAEDTRLSPDGQRVLLTKIEDDGAGRFFPVRYVLPLDGGEPLARFRLSPGAFDPEWVPDGTAITYIDRQQGWNLMRKTLPAGEAEPITSFTDGQVLGHGWHPDGSRLALHRQIGQQQSLWQLMAGEAAPTLITEYKTGRLSRYVWAPDAPLLYFAYSTSSADVVMMSGVE